MSQILRVDGDVRVLFGGVGIEIYIVDIYLDLFKIYRLQRLGQDLNLV